MKRSPKIILELPLSYNFHSSMYIKYFYQLISGISTITQIYYFHYIEWILNNTYCAMLGHYIKEHNKELDLTKHQRSECLNFSNTLTNISFVAAIKIFRSNEDYPQFATHHNSSCGALWRLWSKKVVEFCEFIENCFI